MTTMQKFPSEKINFSEDAIYQHNTVMPHSASVFYLHGGTRTSAQQEKSVIDRTLGHSFEFPHVRVWYPTAPKRNIAKNNPNKKITWISFNGNGPEYPEYTDSINAACKLLHELVQQEVVTGTSVKRIVVGGFGTGGRVAMQYGLRYQRQLGGIFAMSSYIARDSPLFEELESLDPETPLPPLYMTYGQRDSVVKKTWVEETSHKLKSKGVKVQLVAYPDADHSLTKKQISDLHKWLQNSLPGK